MLPNTSSQPRSLARRALDQSLAKVIRARLFIAPVLGSLALTLAFFEPTAWRKLVLAAGVSLLFGLSLIEFWRYRRLGSEAVLLPVNVLLTVLGQIILMTGTGGLFSPVLPALLMLVVMAGLFAGPRTLIALLVMIVPSLWGFALVHRHGWPVTTLVPQLFGEAHGFERGMAPYVMASLFSLMVIAVARVGFFLQNLFESLFEQAVRERDKTLVLHAEQSRVLTRMTAEIAHELKNPLASIKGLSTLVAKDVQGRTAERVGVLRSEVDRMQGILDEFLNLSRPLVPLSLADIDMHELVQDVVLLHEGTAHDRKVSIHVAGSASARVKCDARKVRQVLINLLQNALEVSPAHSSVEVQVEAREDALQVHVLDRGHGLAPSVAARAFEVGVTTKEQGSGIGLAVARSLARQHGGEVTLHAESQGGVRATMMLPMQPSFEAEASS